MSRHPLQSAYSRLLLELHLSLVKDACAVRPQWIGEQSTRMRLALSGLLLSAAAVGAVYGMRSI